MISQRGYQNLDMTPKWGEIDIKWTQNLQHSLLYYEVVQITQPKLE